jgi:hypothetical protein
MPNRRSPAKLPLLLIFVALACDDDSKPCLDQLEEEVNRVVADRDDGEGTSLLCGPPNDPALSDLAIGCAIRNASAIVADCGEQEADGSLCHDVEFTAEAAEQYDRGLRELQKCLADR